MEIIDGRITDYDERGEMVIKAHYENISALARCGYKECRIVLQDSRRITNEQRRRAYALLEEITEYMGEMPEYVKRLFKLKYIHDELKGMAEGIFSLSDCDVTLARDFITYLTDFILAHEIPTRVPLRELCEDVEKYVYSCLMHKRCAVCGRKAELHHVDAVGMGRDRTEIEHEGMRALPLCREHHTEAHMSGKSEFLEKYHLQAVKLVKSFAESGDLRQKTRRPRNDT